MDESEVKIHIGKIRLNFGRDLVVCARKPKIPDFQIQVTQVVVGLEMTRVVFERLGKAVKRFRGSSSLRLEDSDVSIGIGNGIVLRNRLPVRIGSAIVAALVEQQGFLKRAQVSREIKYPF